MPTRPMLDPFKSQKISQICTIFYSSDFIANHAYESRIFIVLLQAKRGNVILLFDHFNFCSCHDCKIICMIQKIRWPYNQCLILIQRSTNLQLFLQKSMVEVGSLGQPLITEIPLVNK